MVLRRARLRLRAAAAQVAAVVVARAAAEPRAARAVAPQVVELRVVRIKPRQVVVEVAALEEDVLPVSLTQSACRATYPSNR